MKTESVHLSVVIPFYNESENLFPLTAQLLPELEKITASFEIIFVDDGSQDDSLVIMKKMVEKDGRIKCFSLSRNFGHQAALIAGLANASGEIIISMDADLQHPPSILPLLYAKHLEGYDVVNTIRIDSKDVGFLKKLLTRIFYFVINRISETQIRRSSSDFRLMSRNFLNDFLQLNEKNRFNRGLIEWMGHRQYFFEYQASDRHKGKTKYHMGKMLTLSFDAITSFSSKPLRLFFFLGLFTVLTGMIYVFYALYKYFQNEVIEGWTSTLMTILILGGLQILSIGVIGEYISKIYNEVKNRPLYIIKDVLQKKEE